MKHAAFLVALALALPAAARAQQFRGVTVETTLDQSDFLPDEDMAVKIRITNRSGQPLEIGQADDWIAFNVEGADNYLVRKLGNMPNAGAVTVPPGMMYTRIFNPTPYFDIRQPGHYFIAATVKIPQWGQEITSKAAAFSVGNGIPVPGYASLEFGLPHDGDTNAAPETRIYSLLKTTDGSQLTLYFRLADNHGKTLHCFRLAPMTSFSSPEAQMDRLNNLHVLSQVGAHEFIYDVLTPDGALLIRQTYVYTDSRPRLTVNERGNIAVIGGVRRYSAANDIPSPNPDAPRW